MSSCLVSPRPAGGARTGSGPGPRLERPWPLSRVAGLRQSAM